MSTSSAIQGSSAFLTSLEVTSLMGILASRNLRSSSPASVRTKYSKNWRSSSISGHSLEITRRFNPWSVISHTTAPPVWVSAGVVERGEGEDPLRVQLPGLQVQLGLAAHHQAARGHGQPQRRHQRDHQHSQQEIQLIWCSAHGECAASILL